MSQMDSGRLCYDYGRGKGPWSINEVSLIPSNEKWLQSDLVKNLVFPNKYLQKMFLSGIIKWLSMFIGKGQLIFWLAQQTSISFFPLDRVDIRNNC
jgi:hypothetical protein